MRTVRANFLTGSMRERRSLLHHWSMALPAPARGVVVPELLELFLQQVRTHALQVVAQKIAQAQPLGVGQVLGPLEQAPTRLLERRLVAVVRHAPRFGGAHIVERQVGAGVHTAYAVQIALALVLAASLAWLWQSDAAFELKASAMATGSLLATPYVLDYDLVVLAVAIAFFARYGLNRGFRDHEISLLAAAWIVPLLSRGIAGVTGIPLGLLALLALYVFTLRRAVLDRAGSAAGAHGIAQA